MTAGGGGLQTGPSAALVRGRIASLALAAAVLVGGCGGSDSESGRARTPPPPPAPAHPAPDLEALLPSELDGTRLTKASATGADVFGDDVFSREMTRFLRARGKQPGDLRFANARDPSQALDVEIGVFGATGVDASLLRRAIVESSRPGAPGLAVSPATLAGKQVTRVVYSSGSTLYLYEHDDLVFYAGSQSDELAARALAALP